MEAVRGLIIDDDPAGLGAGAGQGLVHPFDAGQGDALISSTAQSINQARSQLASTSDVDMEKVNQIRQAISEGRLELDMDALSQAILDMHRR